MSKTKITFPIVTECPDCQGIADAKKLFLTVERLAIREGVAPHRMARALRELLAAWYSVTLGAFGPENGGSLEGELERIIAATTASLRHQVKDGDTGTRCIH